MNNSRSAGLMTDPLSDMGLREFGRRLRRGQLSAVEITERYLARIAALDPRLGAFQHVDTDGARRQAKAIDALLDAGVDLGPLMGVPVAVKDLFAIEGLPTTAGSLMPVADTIGPEGPFVRMLRKAGCVILGLTRTVECAFGAAGINSVRGTPWNPWDANTPRLPGGSSSGSAVAVAAGLCGFAIGTDTGGSVRVPAALCGIFGLKTTVGHWPTDGVFSLSSTLDSIGLLTRDADDAQIAFAALSNHEPVDQTSAVRGLRFGRMRGYVERELDERVRKAYESGIEALREQGAHIEDVLIPEAAERETIIPVILGAEVLATLGRRRFDQHRASMDPVVEARIANALDITADGYVLAQRRMRALQAMARERIASMDGWILPTTAVPPLPVSDFATLEQGVGLSRRITQCTQPGNVFGLSGFSVPLPLRDGLPIGLQVLAAPGAETAILAIARGMQQALGGTVRPDLAAFESA